jgi:hypothetical protein
MDHHEAAAADIAGARISHGKSKTDRDRGIDGIAALLQDVSADARSESLLRHDHAVLRDGTLRMKAIGFRAALIRARGQWQRKKPGKRETKGASQNAIVRVHRWDKRLAWWI